MGTTTTKFNVTTSVSEKEQLMFKAWAERQGISLSQFARNTLLAAVPAEVRSHYLGTDPVEAAPTSTLSLTENIVAQVQDRLEGKAVPAVQAGPVVYKEPMQELMEAPRETLHPCMFLKRYFMPPMTARDCQGTCSSSRQAGKPCHWAAGVANNCNAYQPFHVPLR